MNRTIWLKLANLITVMVFITYLLFPQLFGVEFGTPTRWGINTLLFLGALVSLVLLRPIYQGLNQLRLGNDDAALERAARFLELLVKQPWRRWCFFFSLEVFTRKPEVLAYHLIGQANIRKENFVGAQEALEFASELDPLCPTVFASRAVLATLQGDTFLAEAHRRQARALGYSNSITDRLFGAGGAVTSALVSGPTKSRKRT